MRSIEQISHKLDGYAAAIRPEREVRRLQAMSQAVTDNGMLRGDRIDGFIPPQHLPEIERGYVVDVDIPSILAGAVGEVTVAIATAEENDAVILGAPSSLGTGVLAFGFVSSTGVVTIRFFNGTAGTINPGLASWRVVVTT